MARKKEWREGEMILTFKLNKIIEHQTATMQEWLSVIEPNFNAVEQGIFESLLHKALKVSVWSEENLKMKFISPILELGQVLDSDNLESEVQGYKLSVKVDFTIGSGLLDYMETPYFHFQEYKPQKNPTGDPMAQLLEAFLIAQEKNKASGKIVPLYGCEIIGKNWTFITMEANAYCVSKSFDSTDKEDLLKIISILRKFREILETKLLVS
jgi:hypothetical protein